MALVLVLTTCIKSAHTMLMLLGMAESCLMRKLIPFAIFKISLITMTNGTWLIHLYELKKKITTAAKLNISSEVCIHISIAVKQIKLLTSEELKGIFKTTVMMKRYYFVNIENEWSHSHFERLFMESIQYFSIIK